MASSNSNRTLVPEAKESLNKFKYEVASDIAVKNIFEQLISKATSSFHFQLIHIPLWIYNLFHNY